MNSIASKKIIFVFVLLILSSFSFAQNIKVIGVIPKTDTGKMYQLQVGAYRQTVNADKASNALTRNGFVPQYEKHGDLVRVFIVVNALEVRSAVDKLGKAGFREVYIREHAGAVIDTKPAEVKPAEPVPVETDEPEVHHAEDWEEIMDVEFED